METMVMLYKALADSHQFPDGSSVLDRLNAPTRHLNNISRFTVITNRTIGLNSFPWQNLLIIMHQVL